MRRETRQLGLADALVSGKGGARLERIAGALDWSALDALLADLRIAPTGRPGWPPLSMLKALRLAQWYGLSAPEFEDALADRLSFRRFVGLPLGEGVPDETVICRFRNEFAERGLTGRLQVRSIDMRLWPAALRGPAGDKDVHALIDRLLKQLGQKPRFSKVREFGKPRPSLPLDADLSPFRNPISPMSRIRETYFRIDSDAPPRLLERRRHDDLHAEDLSEGMQASRDDRMLRP